MADVIYWNISFEEKSCFLFDIYLKFIQCQPIDNK